MQNPHTTLAGWVGLGGTLLVTLAQALPPGKTTSLLTTIGLLLLGGANSVGNIRSQDGAA